MKKWLKPNTEGNALFLCQESWIDHDGMIEAFADECLRRIEFEYDSFDEFDAEMRLMGAEPSIIDWGQDPTEEQKMFNWCHKLCSKFDLYGEEDFPIEASPGEVSDWQDQNLSLIFESLLDEENYSEMG